MQHTEEKCYIWMLPATCVTDAEKLVMATLLVLS